MALFLGSKGEVNFTNFERGPFQNCRLGYKIGKNFEGQGFMSEALRTAVDYIFEVKKIHRVEDNYIPRNERSGLLLQSIGFDKLGESKNYLRINEAWEDHILKAKITPKWKEGN